jgi:hypothetical protein
MPRHPPCALKNLPHDHRTHRPTTTTTGPLPPGEGPAARSTGRRSITNSGTTTNRHPPKGPPSAVAPVLKMLASTIQFSNNNPHTPHSRAEVTTIRPSPPPAGRREPKTSHHPPRTHHHLHHRPREGDQQRRNRCARAGACCLRTQQCAMDRSSTGTSPTVPPPPRPPGQPGSPR